VADDGRDGRGDRPYVVETEPARPKAPSRAPLAVIAVAIVGVVGLSAWGLLAAPGPSPAPTGPPSASAVARSPSVAPGPTLSLPSPDGAGLPSATAGTEVEAFAALAVSGGWPQCPMWRPFSDGVAIDAAAVQAAAEDVGGSAGMIAVRDREGGEQRVWVGGTEDDAARGFGGSAVVHVGDETWTMEPADGRGRAVRLDRIPLPTAGRDAWEARMVAVPASYCGVSFGGPPPAILEVPGTADPYPRFVSEAGWYVCRKWERMDQGVVPEPTDVDAAADLAGVADGPSWVTVPVHSRGAELELPVWVGDDPGRAGISHGTRLVVLNTAEPRRAWMAMSVDDRPMAVAFDVVATPAGRTAWLPTGSAAGLVGGCEPIPGNGGEAPSPSLGPAPAAATSPVDLLRGIPNASALLAQRLGWVDCRMAILEPSPADVPGAMIDGVAESLGVEAGMLQVTVDGATQPVPVFVGTDLVELARIEQVPVVAVDGRPVVWLADETITREWRSMITPRGRTAWVATGAAAWPDGGCAPPPDAAPGIRGFRSLTCWTDRDRCLEAIEAARTLVPDAFGPAVDVAAGLGPTCPALTRCPWTGPNDPVLVTVAPSDWRATNELRVFSTGLRRLSTVASELPVDTVGVRTLALASLPSITLPVAETSAATADTCEGDNLNGPLSARAWDPRVAWVDPVAVRWPAGFVGIFVPDFRMYAPDGSLVGGPGDELSIFPAAGGRTPGEFHACDILSPRTGRP
jgi:hypothetical protein